MISGPDEARRAVREQICHDADVIKVYARLALPNTNCCGNPGVGVGTWPLSRLRPPGSAIAPLAADAEDVYVPALLARKNASPCKASHPAAMTLAGTAGTRMGYAL